MTERDDEFGHLKPKQASFLAAYCVTGNVSGAALASDVSRNSHYNWLSNDEKYAEAFAGAELVANDYLEGEARRRGVEGVKQKKFNAGEPVIDPETGEQYYEHVYSDRLLEFLMRGNMPLKYGMNRHEHTGHDGGPIKVTTVEFDYTAGKE